MKTISKNEILCTFFGHQWIGSKEHNIRIMCRRCGKKIRWIPFQVRGGVCGELLYDPLAREHFLEEDMDGVNHCPGCGAIHRLVKVVKKSKGNE